METEKSFSGEEAEKDFCGRLFFLAAIFPLSNEKACLGVTAKTDFFYRLRAAFLPPFFSAEKNDPTMVRIEERRGGAFIMKSLYNNARNNATAICAIPHTELIRVKFNSFVHQAVQDTVRLRA